MKKIHIANVDLNLLVVLDALMAERHATRAAERIGLTQPAVSHALTRLRALFGDPLFVRSPRGMTPTSLAVEIAPAVRSILEQVEHVLLGERGFDPAESPRQFVLGLSDYAALVLLPRLIARLEREAPNVSLIIRNTSRSVGLQMLDEGAVELLAGNFPSPPSRMREELLYKEDFICAGRKDNPQLAGDLDLDRYLTFRHLQVSLKGSPSGYVDTVLAERGFKRNIVVTVGHFLMAPMMIEASDLLATEPRRLFAPLAERLQLKLCAPPMALPSFRIVQTWHSRHDADRGLQWLRRVIADISQEAL